MSYEARDLCVNTRILIIDADRALREGCANALQSEGYPVTACASGDEALELLRRSPFNVVLIDLRTSDGMDLLRTTRSLRPGATTIVMSDRPSVQSSVDALRHGAWDYLPKPFSATQLQVLVGRAALAQRAAREREQSRAAGDEHGNSDRMTLLGVSPAFRHVLELARKVARTDASVMLVGESGTGKEMLAQFIHRHSRRDRQQLVPLYGAAVPEHLLESEMFGHRKGAFTGADRDKAGLLEVAHNGTFFLDEITEIPLTLQAKLLRVVQDGVLRRVGSETHDAIVNVRFISATNRDPRIAIRNRQLREDLFYRLNVFQIALPPLRDRVEDIPILARHFLEHSFRRHQSPRAAVPTFSEASIDVLQSHAWRGNVRELQNVVEHVAVLATPGEVIHPDAIVLHTGSDAVGDGVPTAPLNEPYHSAKEQVLAQFERDYVQRLVARASGNMSRAARLANVDRTTLYRLLERHGFRREPRETSAA